MELEASRQAAQEALDEIPSGLMVRLGGRMFPSDYVQYVNTIQDDWQQKRLMARLALNLCFDRRRYPVDLCELDRLRYDGAAVAWSFISHVLADRRRPNLSSKELDGLKRICKEEACLVAGDA